MHCLEPSEKAIEMVQSNCKAAKLMPSETSALMALGRRMWFGGCVVEESGLPRPKLFSTLFVVERDWNITST